MMKISSFSHSTISVEIKQRKNAGETPRPTFESLVDEMVSERLRAQRKKTSPEKNSD